MLASTILNYLAIALATAVSVTFTINSLQIELSNINSITQNLGDYY